MNHVVRLALDRSVRSYDLDGRLRVSTALLTRACVSPYMGAEIPGYRELGLLPSRVYQLLRPESELRRALPLFNGLPLLTEHVPVSADDHRGDLVVGATGSSAALVNGEVTNSLVIWASPGIELIETGAARSLSCGYAYTPVVRSGSFQGVAYDMVMTDISPNHLSLVAEGRVSGAMVGDSMPKQISNRSSKMRIPPKTGMDDNDDKEDGEESRKLDVPEIFANLTLYLGDILDADQMAYVNSLLDGNVPDDTRVLSKPDQQAQDHARAVRAQCAAMGFDHRYVPPNRPMDARQEAKYLEMFPNSGRLVS